MKIRTSLCQLFPRILIVGLAGAVAGCSTPSRFRVDALARPGVEPLGGTYRIVGDLGNRGQSPPYFEEIAGQLRAELSARGLVEVPGTAQPDVEIVVDYGVGPPRRMSRESTEMIYGMGTMRTVYASTGSRGVGSGSVYIPTETTAAKRIETSTYFESHLSIVGRQPASSRRNAEMREVWRVEVTTSDQEADVEKLIPLMVTAAARYLGDNSGGRQEVSISSESVLAPEPGAVASDR